MIVLFISSKSGGNALELIGLADPIIVDLLSEENAVLVDSPFSETPGGGYIYNIRNPISVNDWRKYNRGE
jgi:hypothetical protein